MSDTAGCRILVISPSATRALQFVERVQALSGSRTASTSDSVAIGYDAKTELDVGTLGGNKDPLSIGSSSTIPWTIINKYYTADVHFQTHEFEHFRVHQAIGVPAVIYVWGPGEPYKEHIPEIAQKLQHYDPEVTLAVRFGDSVTATNAASLSEEDDGLDEFLSLHGFEFVEGDRTYRRPTQDEDRHSDDEDSGIPGLPRVIDALSTIMWPSLVQSQATRQRKSRARELLGWALEEEADDGLRALIADPSSAASTDPTTAIAAAASERKSRMQREMEELERWLEDEETGTGLRYAQGRADGKSPGRAAVQTIEEDKEAEAWVSSAPVTSVEGWEDILTPPTIRTPRADDGFTLDSATEHGFEDDFADFVSASPDSQLHPHGHREDRLLEVNYDIGRLTPMHTGASYRSLGSISDFGGDDLSYVGRDEAHTGGYGALDDGEEDDPDLPSRAEILETSRRLFGAAALGPPPAAQPSSLSDSAATATASIGQDAGPSTARPVTTTEAPAQDANSSADLSLDSEEGDENHSFASFDLSRVFSALQGMKAEIAGMENEEERRRAAARVALGLVYGLSAQSDGCEDVPHAQATSAGTGSQA
ncbi:hypothetical protein GY45DRAFT_1372025 [Cubamyces sp. BRFM 1775]|nr:hypothetical protein GY45DRAFT_1372025 [Cubamyces sp. BRFM 1775]